jgi:hypothetical protein
MVSIPRSNRRFIPAQAGRTVPVSGAVNEAIGQLGQQMAGMGLDNMADETRQRLAEEQERRQAEQAATRQADMLRFQQTQTRLRETHDEVGEQVLAGAIPAQDAERVWRERASTITADGVAGLSEGYRDAVNRQLLSTEDTLTRSIGKVATKRLQSEVGAGLNQTLEALARDYRTDPAKATAQAMEILATQGPAAGLLPDDIQRKGQTWREQSQFTAGFEAVSAGRDNPAALKPARDLITSMPDLDPQKRAQLLDRASMYELQHQQKREMAAARAQREAERRLNEAEAEFKTFQALADKGTVLAPEYIDRVTRATAGTPYQAGVTALAQQAVQTGGLAAQPINQQRAMLQMLDAEIAKKGRTPELDKRREQLAKVVNGSEADAKADPLRAGLERGVIQALDPLSLQGGVPGVVQQLSERVVQAKRVETWAGRAVSPLTSQEADGLGRLLRAMPTDQKASALQTLATALPPAQGQALAAQLDSQDRGLALALGYGAAGTTQGRPVAELILRGQEAIKTKTVKLDESAELGMTAQFEQGLRDAIVNPEQRAMVRDAARLIYAGKQAEGERISVDGALRLAVGGDLVDRNGSRVVIPAGVTEDQFERHLERYPADSLMAQLPGGNAYVRGQPIPADQFLASLPGAQLRMVGRGRYAVVSGGAVATNIQGRPIVVEAPSAR